jgi:carbamoyl-phosphate synthase small subunit
MLFLRPGMKYNAGKPAILLLEDGTVFHGKAAGYIGTTTGELCFNTGMTGYQEIFTDPSYYGQLLVSTHVHIGNYGIHSEEIESEGIKIAGFICRSFNIQFSRHAAFESIEDYFIRQKLVAVSDVDTRAIVRHVRSKGAMNAIISSSITDMDELKAELSKCPPMEGLELSSKVSTKQSYFYGNPNSKYKVALMDYGVKKNIIRNLASRDCYVQVFPSNATFAQVKNWNPDGVMLSNGPGDPATMHDAVNVVKEVLNHNIPLFGICLGNQLLAEACGISTYKMHHGHRGINHPVKNLLTGKCEITSQNHGFAVNADEVRKNDRVEVTHMNLNDDTIEGIRVKDKVAFSVQYHPEAAPGPHDATYLFDQFTEAMSSVMQHAL